jgi:signal transduction histidine kinase
MEIMISEIDRANAIITDFLSLAKANAESIVRENINQVINKIFPMLQPMPLIPIKISFWRLAMYRILI